jgi:hypothetical protein
VGSLCTVVRVIFFVVILWEAFVAQRTVVYTLVRNRNLEWGRRLPRPYHSFNKPVKIFCKEF